VRGRGKRIQIFYYNVTFILHLYYNTKGKLGSGKEAAAVCAKAAAAAAAGEQFSSLLWQSERRGGGVDGSASAKQEMFCNVI
jgi:hypothetical protein